MAKVKSFTLAELLVVMLITAIVVGLAFSILNLVQKQIRSIEKNFKNTTELNLFEQRLWQDFNTFNTIVYTPGKIIMTSDIDTVNYLFNPDYILRNSDTIKLKLSVEKIVYEGQELKAGYIDAIKITVGKELPNYSSFISKENDAANKMNENGL